MQYALQEFFRHPEDVKLAKLSGDLDGKRIIVQGLGNVGYHAAKFLSEQDGAKIVGVIERDGAIVDDDGINIEELKNHISANRGVQGFPKGQYVEDGASVLENSCDILIPAALEGVINKSNAERIDANLIIEAANGPITSAGDEILRKRGVVIIPDMYANAGGVTVSYFEWVKNLSHIRFGRMQRRAEEMRANLLVHELQRLSDDNGLKWTLSDNFRNLYLKGEGELELVRSGLDDTMRTAYQAMSGCFHARDDVDDFRTAAFVVSIGRIAQSYQSKGL